MRARAILFTVFCVLTLLLSFGCGKSVNEQERQFLILQGALAFQHAALKDHHQALEQFAAGSAREKFQSFDQKIWNFTDPRIGWSYFMNVAVVTPGNMASNTPVIAFYNPWSDVFLLTAWDLDKSGPKIVDAEMLMGDFVRNKGTPPFQPSPAWLRSRNFKPLAVGEATAGAIRAFESAFSKPTAANWRKAIPNLDDAQLVTDLNYAGASLLMNTNFVEIDEVRNTQPDEDPRMAPMRTASVKALAAARSGKIQEVLNSASETIPAVRDALAEMPPKSFGSLRASSYLLGNESSLVFLVPTEGSGFFVSFLFKGKSKKLKLARIDLVDYARMYALTPAPES